MKAPLRGIIAATALAGALALSGCGSEGWSGTAGTAAVVDGNRIRTDDAMVAAEQINEQFKPQQPLTTTDAVNLLIIAPAIIDVADAAGKGVSAGAARTRLPAISDPNPATVTLLQSNAALSSLDQATEQKILDAIKKLDVQVNPRFGTFDAAKAGLVASKPAWISKTVQPQSTTGDATTGS